MKECVGIYIKTEKAQEQDGFSNKMKYHFHITTVHKYRFFVFCLYSSYIYLCRVVMWKWYFILLLKPSCSCAFSVLIYIPTYSFLKMIFIILVWILFLNNSGEFLIKYLMTILFHLQY